MKVFLNLLFIYLVNGWSPGSWRDKPFKQIPVYNDQEKLKHVELKLKNKPPLVISSEIAKLQSEICDVQTGSRFILMGGDCAETFREHSAQNIINNYQLFTLLNILLMNNSGKKIVKIARAAGQFSKPRSMEYESINGNQIYSYKGDMINKESIHERAPDPNLMLQAYSQSAETINLLRALVSCHKFSNININEWKSELKSSIYKLSYFTSFLDNINRYINLLKAVECLDYYNTDYANLYTGHEGLLLNYEEALTRQDRFTKKYYDCSAHFLWIGERTRDINEAHVEFFRGVHNPIGIKVSHKINPNDLVRLIKKLNPENITGRICLITRMGYNISDALPPIIDAVKSSKLIVAWICDPMHGNGKVVNGIKTRDFKDILNETMVFFEIHKKKGTIPGGIHIEMTANDVTECSGGNYIISDDNYFQKKYLSSCDPRLNFFQAVELIEEIGTIM
tara:strand:- start:533 stop:1888 length:1356 start_codon:yes stop_codon:yes gene_type:complete